MAFHHMVWAFDQDIPAMAKLVLLKLSARADEHTDICFPSIERTAKDCSMSRNSVKRAIKLLADRKLISIKHQRHGNGHTVNIYTILGRATQALGRATESLPVGPQRAPNISVEYTINKGRAPSARTSKVRNRDKTLEMIDRWKQESANGAASSASVVDIALFAPDGV